MGKKLFRKRKMSMNSILGITQAKRSFAKATGIPTTKAGRKKKLLNAATGGTYGKYTRARADVLRPYKTAKKIANGQPLYTVGVSMGPVSHRKNNANPSYVPRHGSGACPVPISEEVMLDANTPDTSVARRSSGKRNGKKWVASAIIALVATPLLSMNASLERFLIAGPILFMMVTLLVRTLMAFPTAVRMQSQKNSRQ